MAPASRTTPVHGSCPPVGIRGRIPPPRHPEVGPEPTPGEGHQARRARAVPLPTPTPSRRTLRGRQPPGSPGRQRCGFGVIWSMSSGRSVGVRDNGGGAAVKNRLSRCDRRIRRGLSSVGRRSGREDAQAGAGGASRPLNRRKVPVDDLCESVVHGTHSFQGSVRCVFVWSTRTRG